MLPPVSTDFCATLYMMKGIRDGGPIKKYSVILSVPDPRKCDYLKDYSLDFEHASMTTYLAS